MKIHRYQRYVLSFFVSLFFLFLFQLSVIAQPDGAALFKSNCTQCHSIGKGTVIGPDLKDVHKRRQDDWLAKWIRNSQAVIKSGDKYAVDLYNKYNRTVMTNFNLKEDEMKALLTYMKDESTRAPVANATQTTPGTEEKKTDNTFIYLLITAIILILTVRIVSKVQRAMEKALRHKEGLPEPVPMKSGEKFIHWSRNNKKLIAVALIVLTVVGSVKGWYALAAIGINQNYQPDQPIAFSHKIHAGDNAINCKYCHFGAEKGKTAGIPSANVCMNCHKFIKEGSLPGGTEEIKKIYAALDYNPETQIYGKNQKPIQWTRVHNLPDLTYFNHSQHVKVAGVECETCHGNMAEQKEANQFAPLTMQWCIDCHRTTPVKMAGNHYYDDYHKTLMAKYGADSLITVERIGGTECSKCHY